MELLLIGDNLSCADVIDVARGHREIGLCEEAKERVSKAEKMVNEIISSERIAYSINTGIGELSNVVISPEEARILQENIIRSHCTGVGNPFHEEIVRATMLIRANTMAKGLSGCRLDLLQLLINMINAGVHPIVPEKGSVGASGDLAPLSHIALTLMGEGEAVYKGERLSSEVALKRAGLNPIKLQGKEALSLNNGTQVMTAIGAIAINDAENLSKIADIAGALSLEALEGVTVSFMDAVQKSRPHPGQLQSSRNLLLLTQGSELIHSKAIEKKVHDAYSLRCIPQVHGASRDAIQYAKRVIEIELNSVSDNPIVLVDEGEIVSSGNFHGQPVAIAMDLLGIAIAELGDISERRTARLLDANLSGLPAFLVKNSGLNSGLMLLQYTSAALVSENKVLAHPATVDSIPTSANWEDHVSMGTIAARKCRDIIDNTQYVLAIELICGAQALEFRKNRKPGTGTNKAYEVIRNHIPKLVTDRVLYPDISIAMDLIKTGKLVNDVSIISGDIL